MSSEDLARAQAYIVRDNENGVGSLARGLDNLRSSDAWASREQTWGFGRSDLLTDTPGGSESSLSFTFSGTAFALYGTYYWPDTTPGLPFRVQVDGAVQPSKPPDLTSQPSGLLYQSPTLKDGEHVVNITNVLEGAAGSLRIAALDYAVITPSPTTSLVDEVLMVADSHPNVVFKGVGWKTLGNDWNPLYSAFQNTTHLTSSTGDSFEFAFNGTQVEVYGFRTSNATLSYSIDSGPSQTQNVIFDDEGAALPHQLLLKAPGLSPGSHKLQVAFTQGANLSVDYLLYKPSFQNFASLAPGEGSKPDENNSSPTAASSGQKVSIGAVVGGVMGGLVAIGLFLALFFWLRRRKQQQRNSDRDTMTSRPFYWEDFASPTQDASTSPLTSERKGRSKLLSPSSVTHQPFRVPVASSNEKGTPVLSMPVPVLRGPEPSTQQQPGPDPQSQVEQLRLEVERLVRENAQLSADAIPPAYTDSGRP